jgi:crotonobetainyl-CoA:carnitine CoA-transferase CaiB-like acyl-CoA transferase
MFYKILAGIKIIEYGNLFSAPFCAKILADLGAEVLKIEKPNIGDEGRRQKPFLKDTPGLERSGLFQYLNMNKLGITLNLNTDTGKKIFTELITDSNVFIENIPPQKRKALGITYQFLKGLNPSVIMTSITPFGQSGPYREYKSCELLNAHMGGVGYASTREVDSSQEPIKLPAHILGFQAGLSAAVATMGAVYKQSLLGFGDHIDVSEQESVFQNLAIPLARYSYANQIVSRTDVLDRAPFHIIPCKDGYIYHAFVHEYQWQRFVELMGSPEWAKNELFKDYESRGKYWDALKPLILEWTMKHTMEEIYRSSQERGAPIGAVYTAKDILDSGQLAARDFFVQIEHPECGTIKYPGIPYKFSEMSRQTPEAAPLLGQHNEHIYCGRLGYTKHDLIKLKETKII